MTVASIVNGPAPKITKSPLWKPSLILSNA